MSLHWNLRSFRVPLALACIALFALPAFAERLTPEKLMQLKRIGDAAVSPDGQQIAYLVTSIDLAADSSSTSLMIQPVSSEASAVQAKGFGTPLVSREATVLLENVKGLNSLSWIQRPDGARLLYIAPSADEAATPQAWLMDPADPQSAKQLTSTENGIANLKASPSGDMLAFTMDIKLDAAVTELYADLPKANARIIDALMYRHWNVWHDYTYSHLHTAKLSADDSVEVIVDLMEGMRTDCPLAPFGGAEQFAFSPDGSEVALTLKLSEHPAESTDSGVYLVPSSGGEMKLISPRMDGYDRDPSYSSDGSKIVFHSMQRPGFEADRNRLFVYHRSSGQLNESTAGLDQTAHGATWSNHDRLLYYSSETRGTTQVYQAGPDPADHQQLSIGPFDFSVVAAVPNSRWLLIKQQNMLRPTELALLHVDNGQLLTITDVNGELFESLDLPTIEERFVTATDGKQIQAWVILPPDFSAADEKKWPMITYCQGGPQGQIGQFFSYRWNFHLMAANGYVVLAPNRRGLPGFGQAWNDQISGDWGGQAMQDILSATDAMLAEPQIDSERVAAAGASFGGYTVYWLMGNAGDRFCTMISHCGVFNLESMYGSTEELFFVNWDLGGPYWSSEAVAGKYELFSPHKYVGNWKTPLLVIHGEKDFRVPITQGMEAFTAAQVQRIPCRFLYFPEEGHWVTKPQNSVLWQRVFYEWLDQYCKPAP